MKKIICFIIVVAVIFGTTTWGFASTKDENTINSINELKMELAKYSGPDEISSMVQADLAEKVDTKTKEAFVNEKMELFFEKLKDIEMSNSEERHIDLGDNCEVIITVSDVSEGCEIRPLANTPGATTLWKDYGNRMFTTKFEVRAVAFNSDIDKTEKQVKVVQSWNGVWL